MIELGGLINAMLGFGSAIAKDKLQRHQQVQTATLKALGAIEETKGET